MRTKLLAGAAATLICAPAFAQDVPQPVPPSNLSEAALASNLSAEEGVGDIVVTARQRAESLHREHRRRELPAEHSHFRVDPRSKRASV